MLCPGFNHCHVGCKHGQESTYNTQSSQSENTQPTPRVEANKETVVVKLESKSGSTATGVAIFVQEYGQVRVISEFEGLTPGIHAMHLHEKQIALLRTAPQVVVTGIQPLKTRILGRP